MYYFLLEQQPILVCRTHKQVGYIVLWCNFKKPVVLSLCLFKGGGGVTKRGELKTRGNGGGAVEGISEKQVVRLNILLVPTWPETACPET